MGELLAVGQARYATHRPNSGADYAKPSVVCLKFYKDDMPEAKGKVNAVLAGVVSGLVAGGAAALLIKGYH